MTRPHLKKVASAANPYANHPERVICRALTQEVNMTTTTMTLDQALYLARKEGTALSRACMLDGVEFGARATQVINGIEAELPARPARSFDVMELVEALYRQGHGRWYRRD